MKKCPECGEIGDDASIFCQNCGNKLENIENRTVNIVFYLMFVPFL